MEQVKSELRIIKNQWVPEIPKESSNGSLRRDSAVLAFIEASDIERSNRLGLIRHLMRVTMRGRRRIPRLVGLMIFTRMIEMHSLFLFLLKL